MDYNGEYHKIVFFGKVTYTIIFNITITTLCQSKIEKLKLEPFVTHKNIFLLVEDKVS